jgi:hypothetical protein
MHKPVNDGWAVLLEKPRLGNELETARFFASMVEPSSDRARATLGESPLSPGKRAVGVDPRKLAECRELSPGGPPIRSLRSGHDASSRRAGTSVFYSVTDGEVFQLLEVARAILGRGAESRRALLEELAAE